MLGEQKRYSPPWARLEETDIYLLYLDLSKIIFIYILFLIH